MHPSRRPRSSHPPSRACGRPLRRRFFAQDKRNPRNRVRSAFACESHVRRSDDSAPRAKAWSPPSSCSDAAPERTCARTDGNGVARPSCLPITGPLPHCWKDSAAPGLRSGGAGWSMVRFLNQQSHCTTVIARLSATDSCSPHPIRRLRRHLPHFVEKGPATTTRSTRPHEALAWAKRPAPAGPEFWAEFIAGHWGRGGFRS